MRIHEIGCCKTAMQTNRVISPIDGHKILYFWLRLHLHLFDNFPQILNFDQQTIVCIPSCLQALQYTAPKFSKAPKCHGLCLVCCCSLERMPSVLPSVQGHHSLVLKKSSCLENSFLGRVLHLLRVESPPSQSLIFSNLEMTSPVHAGA